MNIKQIINYNTCNSYVKQLSLFTLCAVFFLVSAVVMQSAPDKSAKTSKEEKEEKAMLFCLSLQQNFMDFIHQEVGKSIFSGKKENLQSNNLLCKELLKTLKTKKCHKFDAKFKEKNYPVQYRVEYIEEMCKGISSLINPNQEKK